MNQRKEKREGREENREGRKAQIIVYTAEFIHSHNVSGYHKVRTRSYIFPAVSKVCCSFICALHPLLFFVCLLCYYYSVLPCAVLASAFLLIRTAITDDSLAFRSSSSSPLHFLLPLSSSSSSCPLPLPLLLSLFPRLLEACSLLFVCVLLLYW